MKLLAKGAELAIKSATLDKSFMFKLTASSKKPSVLDNDNDFNNKNNNDNNNDDNNNSIII